MKKLIRFIVNPISGTKSKSNLAKEVSDALDSNLFDHEVVFTEAPRHAIELTTQAVADHVDIVVAVGGDGTVNEVASALVHTDTRLAVVPYGSGNGFAMHLGLGRNPQKAITFLNDTKELLIDSCKVNDHFYVNLAGVGFDARVAYELKNSKTRGFQAYFKNSVEQGIKYKNQVYRVQYDNEEIVEGKFLSITIANASMFGYNFTIAPNADLSDGVLDVVHIKDAPKYKYFANMHRFLNRSILKTPLTHLKFAKKVSVRSDEPIYFHIDGEGMITDKELVFSIIPASLKVLVPSTPST